MKNCILLRNNIKKMRKYINKTHINITKISKISHLKIENKEIDSSQTNIQCKNLILLVKIIKIAKLIKTFCKLITILQKIILTNQTHKFCQTVSIIKEQNNLKRKIFNSKV